MNFAGRLVLGTVLVLLFTVAVLVSTSEISLRHDLEREVARSLEREARLVRDALPASPTEWQSTVRALARENGHRITVIDSQGLVRAESDVAGDSLSRLENHLSRPEVQAALRGETGLGRRISATLGRPLIYIAVPGGPGIVRVAATLEQVDATVQGAQRSVLWASLLALGIGVAVAFIAGRSVAGPLTELTHAAGSIAAGEAPLLPHSGISDVDALVRAIREMHEQLAHRFDELRRERAESAALLESMVEGVLASDAAGRIVMANSAARRLLGYPGGEPLPDLPQLFRLKAAREVVDAALAGTSVLGREVELEPETVLMSARPLPSGGALLVLHDITELRRLEAIRRDFVANVSHELKTPLTSIAGYAETLLGESTDAPTARRFLEVIQSNARRMQRLVDDLLDLSRIESGHWKPQPALVDSETAIRDAWSGFAERAAARHVEFRSSVQPGAAQFRADPEAVRQVLGNLMDNALRHVGPSGWVSVACSPNDGGILLQVADNGSGMAREHLPRIFERFYRADPSRSREAGGTGLGLAIVKHLVEAHGGRVSAESEIGQGTTVSCWFPLG